ncbi:unnamed protein product [Victoria cruziana]
MRAHSFFFILLAVSVAVVVVMPPSIRAVPSSMLGLHQNQTDLKNVDGPFATGDCNYRCKCCYCWRYGRKTPKCLICCAN